jgi:hypothetical protein
VELSDGQVPIVARYTQRQRSAVERIIASLEDESIVGQTDADAAYAAEVARPIEEDYEMRIWHTMTRQGKRTFQTQLDEWPWPSPDGGHLVRDLGGDLFRLPALETLDEKSRSCLWAYVG